MMRVRMTVGLVGPAFTLEPGDEHEFPDAQAIRMIQAGSAIPVAERVAETTAVQPVRETRRERRRKRHACGIQSPL
jgi:hypothetical protein